LPDENQAEQANKVKPSLFLARAVMFTNLWEMFAFPLRWSMEHPWHYRFVKQEAHDGLSPMAIVDLLMDVIVVTNMVKTSASWFRKTTPRFALNLFWQKFGHDLLFGVVVMWLTAPFHFTEWVWRTFTLYRVMRIKRALQYMNAKQYDVTINAVLILGLKFGLVLYVSLHWVGCFCYMVAGLNDFDETTWTAYITANVFPRFDFYHSSELERYIIIIFKALDVITLTGIFYSPPNNTLEVLMACVVMVSQLVLTSYVFGTLLHMLQFKDNSLELHKERIARLKVFCHQRELPNSIYEELVEHFEFQFRKHSGEKQVGKLKKPLPEALAQAVAECMYGGALHKCQTATGAPLRGCSGQFMRVLATYLREEYYRPGELLLKEGDVSSQLLFLVVGTVHMSYNNVVIKSLDASSPDVPMVGEVAFFIGAEQPYKVVVDNQGYAKMLVLSRDKYMGLTHLYPEQHEMVMQNIVHVYGVNRIGEIDTSAGASHLRDEDQAQLPRIRGLIQTSLHSANMAALAALVDAAVMGNTEEVLRVVHMGLDIDSTNYDGQTALHIMAKAGFKASIEALLREGVNINLPDRWGRTALQVALLANQQAVAKLLTTWGAEAAVDEGSGAALCDVAFSGNATAVKALLDSKVDPNNGDYDERRPLHTACAEGHRKIAAMLLHAGADANAKDRWGGEPLLDAIQQNQPQVGDSDFGESHSTQGVLR